MKLIFTLIAIALLILPLYSAAQAKHYVRCTKQVSRYYSCCYRYYDCHRAYCCKTYYPYYYFSLDGELDNACVDACLDLKHSLKQCTRSCYNY